MINVIAVDGPAGSGKGTLARELAGRFSMSHLDTGLMFRAFGFSGLSDKEIAKYKISDYLKLLASLDEETLRRDDVSSLASNLAINVRVRKEIARLQHEFAEEQGKTGKVSIIDGRDIGTAIFPDSFCKFFITAELRIRALRRFASLRAEDPELTLAMVEDRLSDRDDQDSHRKHSPLKLAEDYIVIDTSNQTVVESLARMTPVIEERLRLIQN